MRCLKQQVPQILWEKIEFLVSFKSNEKNWVLRVYLENYTPWN